MATAVVQIVLRSRAAAEEGEDLPGGEVTAEEIEDRKTLVFNKQIFVERLVLEEAMWAETPRCCLFLIQFMMFLAMLWISYPASKVLPVHQALREGLAVDIGGESTQPEDVVTIEGLKDYLAALADSWRTFSPGSSMYVTDPLARTYLGNVVSFPPQQFFPSTLEPVFGRSFTISAWIQTSVRYDTLLRKVQEGRDDAVCWQFDLERILYGEHQGGKPVQVVHPLATSIYEERAVQEEAWKTSKIRARVSDSQWHHYAVLVQPLQVQFVLDGAIQGTISLPRPITDCPGGSMTIGSNRSRGSIVDLKYLPRVLTTVELSFLRSRGKLLDDMLAGSGKPPSSENPMQTVMRMQESALVTTKANIRELDEGLTETFRQLAINLQSKLDALEGRVRGAIAGDARRLQGPGVAAEDPQAPAVDAVGAGGEQGRVGRAAGAAVPLASAHSGGPRAARPAGAAALRAARWRHREANSAPAAPGLSGGGCAGAGCAPQRLLAMATTTMTTTVATAGAACGDAASCEPLLLSGAVQGIALLPPSGSALRAFTECLAGDASHLTKGILGLAASYPTASQAMLPPSGSCDMITGCVSTLGWADWDQQTCDDYLAQQWCRDGSTTEHWTEGQQDRGARGACCACGGGGTATLNLTRLPSVDDEGRPGQEATLLSQTAWWVLSALGTVESERCNSADDGDAFRAACPYTCGTCWLSRAPQREAAGRALLTCNDASYADWLGRGCSWYALNDPATEDLPSCSKYGDEQTRASCPRTCGTCDHSSALFRLYDFDGNGKIKLEELNALSLFLDLSFITRGTFQDEVKSLCTDVGVTNPACWLTDNYPEMAPSLLSSPLSPCNQLLTAIAPVLLSELEAPSSFWGLNNEQLIVERFPMPRVMDGRLNLALQQEQLVAVFTECQIHNDCAGMSAAACGNVDAPKNMLCSRAYEVPLYCSPSCRTGGCGQRANALPRSSGRYCQPCDACVLEAAAAQACPSWCDGYAVDERGDFPRRPAAAPAGPGGTVAAGQDNLPGSFTLTAWVRHFTTQWMFEKRIRIPGLSSSWAGYDNETQSLVCWQVSPTEVRFRSRWSEKALTSVKNPLAAAFISDPDSWHHVVLLKNSLVDDMGVRREDLRFMVDGELAPAPMTAWGGRQWDVPAYGFPDCGGEQLSTTSLSQNVFEGPRDFYSDVLLPEWNGDLHSPQFPSKFTLPLGVGKRGMTALTFEDVDIPWNATIRLAQLSICAAQTMMDYQQEVTCGTSPPVSARLKIAGLIASPAGLNASSSACFLSSLAGGAARTRSEVQWQVDIDAWRQKGVPQVPDFVESVAGVSCSVLTPDIKELVSEMLARSGPGRDLTFLFADVNKSWGECGSRTIFDNRTAFGQQLPVDLCAAITAHNELMTSAMPLWMIPLADLGRPGAIKTKLLVQYCLNEECLSPSFLGAGSSALVAAGADARRRLQEEAGESRASRSHEAVAEDEASAGATARGSPGRAGGRAGASGRSSGRERRAPSEASHREGSAGHLPAAAAAGQQASSGRRLAANSTCGEGTCLSAGGALDVGLVTEGLLLDPRYVFRAMAASELQSQYYAGLPSVQAVGQEQLTGATELIGTPTVDVVQYPREVVSIIPPVIFQRRSPVVPCDNHVPALAFSLQSYFNTQIGAKCHFTYACSKQSGFECIDRQLSVSPEERHFGTKTLSIKDVRWFPEFLDMFTVPIIYRKDVVQTRDWVDLQTSEVLLVNIFLTPNLRSGTILSVRWTYTGPGRIRGNTDMKSFVQMSPSDRSLWSGVNLSVVLVAGLDLLFILLAVYWRFRHRRQTFREMPALTDKLQDMVRQAIPLWEPTDYFDVFLRVINVGFGVWHFLQYPSPEKMQINGAEQLVGELDRPILKILELEWKSEAQSTEEKVDYFMNQVIDLDSQLARDDTHRFYARLLILLFFVRVVIFMRVHPKIAILYATILEMAMDFFHFLVLFATLFGVLAFLGSWSFGDFQPDFGDFETAMYTQFRMLVGEYNLAEGQDSGFQVTFGIYAILYFLLVFSLLLNFFLAIVIDSYSKIKDSVKDCQVENSVVWDLFSTFTYPILALLHGWPQRRKLIAGIMTADLDQDGKNDEEQDTAVPISAATLDKFGLVKGLSRATALMRHYKMVCPAVGFNYQEQPSELEYKKIYKQLTALDTVRHAMHGQTMLTTPDGAGASDDPVIREMKTLGQQFKMLQDSHLEASQASARELQDLKVALVRPAPMQMAPEEAASAAPQLLLPAAVASQEREVDRLSQEVEQLRREREEDARERERLRQLLLQETEERRRDAQGHAERMEEAFRRNREQHDEVLELLRARAGSAGGESMPAAGAGASGENVVSLPLRGSEAVGGDGSPIAAGALAQPNPKEGSATPNANARESSSGAMPMFRPKLRGAPAAGPRAQAGRQPP